jgi:hypothetical protein
MKTPRMSALECEQLYNQLFYCSSIQRHTTYTGMYFPPFYDNIQPRELYTDSAIQKPATLQHLRRAYHTLRFAGIFAIIDLGLKILPRLSANKLFQCQKHQKPLLSQFFGNFIQNNPDILLFLFRFP